MELDNGFRVLRKNRWIWLLPTVLSLVSLLLTPLFGFFPTVQRGIHIKFAVPTGMPDLDSILKLEQMNIGVPVRPQMLLFALISILVDTFFTGGWLAMVFAALRGTEPDKTDLWEQSRYFFSRLLLTRILTLLVGIFGLVLLAIFLGPLAFILLILAFVGLMYVFFWELAIVGEDLSVGEGFTRGYEVLRANLGEVLRVVLPIALYTAIISLVANLIAQHILGYVLLIPVWSYIGGGFSAAICALYERLTKLPTSPPINNLQ